MSDQVYRSARGAADIEARYRQVLAQWPVAKSEHYVPTRLGTTFVVASGPLDGPPVVLLHGSQANSAAWLADIALWSSRFRLYAIDMIGEAGLSARVRPNLASDAHALWLDDVFEALGLAHCSLVGTSLGGWLALDYASRRPAAVDALALICPAGIGRQKNLLLEMAPLLLLGPWGARKIRERVIGPPPPEIPVDLQAMASLMQEIGAAIKPRVVTIPRLSDEQLHHLVMPMLVIVGGRDALHDSADTRSRLQRHVPAAEVVFIEDGYHFLPNQTERVMAFLERSLL